MLYCCYIIYHIHTFLWLMPYMIWTYVFNCGTAVTPRIPWYVSCFERQFPALPMRGFPLHCPREHLAHGLAVVFSLLSRAFAKMLIQESFSYLKAAAAMGTHRNSPGPRMILFSCHHHSSASKQKEPHKIHITICHVTNWKTLKDWKTSIQEQNPSVPARTCHYRLQLRNFQWLSWGWCRPRPKILTHPTS